MSELKLSKERANVFTNVEVFMKGGFEITKKMESVYKYLIMERITRVKLKIICGMVKEFIRGLVAVYIKVNI